MRENGWKPEDVYKEFDADLSETKPKREVTKRKKAVWELIDDILHAGKDVLSQGGVAPYAEEVKEETEEEVVARIRRDEERKQQKIVDMRLAESAKKIKEKREKERKAREEEIKHAEEEKRREREHEEKERADKTLRKKLEQDERECRLRHEAELKLKEETERKVESMRQETIQRERQEVKDTEDFLKNDAKDSMLLYERSVCLNKTLAGHSLPEKLMKGQLTDKETTLMRYQTIAIPLFDTRVILTKLLPYFLLNSAIGVTHIGCDRGQYKFFVYNCVGCVLTALACPLNKPLVAVSPEIQSRLRKTLVLVFDTESGDKSEIIANALKRVPLNQVFSAEDLEALNLTYQVEHKEPLKPESTLNDLTVVVEYCVDNYDTFKPIKPAWEILARELAMKSYSPCSMAKAIPEENEDVCVSFKELAINSGLQNSFAWTLGKALDKGLVITGIRIGYIGFDSLETFRDKVINEVCPQFHTNK